MTDQPSSTTEAETAAADDRRGFISGMIAMSIGAVACLVPAITGVVAFLNPLRQKSAGGQFVRLASLDSLPEDGTPRRVPVIADRTDAWNRFPNEPIGAVFLRRNKKGQVEAINEICPHAGCTVTFGESIDEKTGKKTQNYFCPCHQASFDLTGRRLEENSDCPRPLDTLEVDPKRLETGDVWVKFQNFETGTANKVAKA